MLDIEKLHVAYGPVVALGGVDLEIQKGAIVSIIGANGAGKTTLLNTISGLVRQKSGVIKFEEREAAPLDAPDSQDGDRAGPGRAQDLRQPHCAGEPDGGRVRAHGRYAPSE